MTLRKFQFHEGPIKTLLWLILLAVLLRFNSMKVRLKHYVKRFPSYFSMFQFHEGPIKTRERTSYERKQNDVSIP